MQNSRFAEETAQEAREQMGMPAESTG